MEALLVQPGLTVPADALSVSYSRKLEEGGPEAARQTPTTVELRCDLRAWPELDAAQREKILAFRPLSAGRTTVRVVCDEFRSRAGNLRGAREMLARAIAAALAEPTEAPEPPPRRRRGAGLIKREG